MAACLFAVSLQALKARRTLQAVGHGDVGKVSCWAIHWGVDSIRSVLTGRRRRTVHHAFCRVKARAARHLFVVLAVRTGDALWALYACLGVLIWDFIFRTSEEGRASILAECGSCCRGLAIRALLRHILWLCTGATRRADQADCLLGVAIPSSCALVGRSVFLGAEMTCRARVAMKLAF